MCVLTLQLELAIADAKQFCEWDPNPSTRAEAEALLEAAEVCCHRLDDTVVPIAAHARVARLYAVGRCRRAIRACGRFRAALVVRYRRYANKPA